MRTAPLRVACAFVLTMAPGAWSSDAAQQPAPSSSASSAASQRALLDKYCVSCHNARLKNGNLQLDTADINTVGEHGEVWEKVVRKLRGGVMPPPGAARPDKATYEGLVSWIESELDRRSAAKPNPGRTESFHRLNRTEYRNIVRDLLGIDMDFSDLLPIDDSGGGEASFDNIAASLRLTQALMEQYLSVALKVARQAVGSPPPVAELFFKVHPDLRQDTQLEGLPFGTRGGLAFEHIFPVDGDYDLRVGVVGGGVGQIELAIDGERIKLFDVRPMPRDPNADADAPPPAPPTHDIRVPIKAGPRRITAAFLRTMPSIRAESDRTPFFGGRGNLPGVAEVMIKGPLTVVGKGDTPSRQRIFTCKPASATEDACAKTILSNLARRAYRRPLTAHDTTVLMGLYKEGRTAGDFESGVERGIRGMLVNPNFLLRVEADPKTVAPGQPYQISDLELASRLSFFLWSSIPDDQLLNLAIKGQLRQPATLEKQVRRMLADPRSESLTTSFASQWLWVRNLKAVMPSEPIFPNFDESLKQAFQREIELFFDSIVREDRSAVDLLDADYTFVNERLARHYGIANVMGTDFRRVQLAADSPRRGLLGKGLLLIVTSRSTRTSPVVRGKWILENLLGTPPPAPPANVPPLPEQKQADGKVLTVRELMARHRANPVCASCHATIDPAGFALEQFDAVGKWRTVDAGFQPIDASGALPDGTKFSGINDFRTLLLAKRDQFLRTMTNKLTMYALGRGTEYYDAAAIRKIVRDASRDNYKFSSIVLGIVKSTPFQMRTAAAAPAPPAKTASR